MIARIWRTGIDPARAEEHERFAEERSLPMFQVQQGFAGAVEALDQSASYHETVAALVGTDLLRGEQSVELLKVHGGELPR